MNEPLLHASEGVFEYTLLVGGPATQEIMHAVIESIVLMGGSPDEDYYEKFTSSQLPDLSRSAICLNDYLGMDTDDPTVIDQVEGVLMRAEASFDIQYTTDDQVSRVRSYRQESGLTECEVDSQGEPIVQVALVRDILDAAREQARSVDEVIMRINRALSLTRDDVPPLKPFLAGIPGMCRVQAS